MRLQNKMLLCLLIAQLFAIQCEDTKWLEVPPSKYIGEWNQYFDEPFYGEIPASFTINEELVIYQPLYFEGEDVQERTLPIKRISKTGNKIVIFCGKSNNDHISDYRFLIKHFTSEKITISEIISTGFNQDDEVFL